MWYPDVQLLGSYQTASSIFHPHNRINIVPKGGKDRRIHTLYPHTSKENHLNTAPGKEVIQKKKLTF